MIGSGFGGAGIGDGNDVEALARQYWAAWGEAMRQGAATAGIPGAQQPGWQQATQWWSQLMPGLRPQTADVVGQFNQLASGWYGQMQQIAAQFAGQNASADEITRAWREALEAASSVPNPFAEMFRSVQAGSQENLGQWLQQATPFIEALQNMGQADQSRWLHLPTFGLAREHQERWQHLLQAHQDYQQRNNDYNALMAKIMQQAFSLFESELVEHEAPGRQLTSARALFDLWIDAAEDAYAEAALSEEFREVYGTLTNAQMRLRGAVQVEVEKICGLFGMPSRTEVDSAHRKIAQLERSLRQLQREATPRGRAATAAEAPKVVVRKPAPAVDAAAKKPVAKQAKPSAARKVASRKPAPASSKPKPARAAKAAKAGPVRATKAAKPKSASATKATTPKPARRRTLASRVATASKRAPAAAKPAAASRSAAKTAKASKPAVARPTGAGGVVSMKDWVARYAAPAPLAPQGKDERR